MFYLGLIAVITLGSLTSLSMPIVAAEASSSSGESSSMSSKVSSSSDSGATSSSSSSAVSDEKTADNYVTAKSNVATVGPRATTSEPAAPTEGVKDSSFPGLYIIVPLLTGITNQPQLEQYLVADSKTKLASADLSVRVATWTFPIFGSNVLITPTRWTLNADGNTWTKSTDAVVKQSGTDNNPKIAIPNSLAVGTYYFQYNATVRGFWGTTSDETSKLVKVKVVDAPVNATAITMATPNVVFEQATYSGVATTTPYDATGNITWKSTLSNDYNITWNQQTGRNSSYIVKQPTDVNDSTTDPGIKRFMTATIMNPSGTGLVAPQYIYVGGLVAKEMAANDGGTWSLDSQGIIDLNKVTMPADGSQIKWNYQWQYSTDNGSTFKNITTSNSDGVSNYSGSLTSITDLNDAANTLTFTKTSGFVKAAAAATATGNSYVMRSVLSADIPTSNGGAKKITINSNKAKYNVTPVVTRLTLDEVPSYSFDNITASDIYNGTENKKTAKTSNLAITDTRDNQSWSLSAKMTKMTSDLGTQFENDVSILNTVSGETRVKVTDNSKDNLALTRDKGGSLTTPVTGALYLQANHKTQLTDDEHFSSTITWTLTGDAPLVKNA